MGDRGWSKGYERDTGWSKGCERDISWGNGCETDRAGARVSIEEIAPIYIILHAKAFQMQSAPIHLPFKAHLL